MKEIEVTYNGKKWEELDEDGKKESIAFAKGVDILNPKFQYAFDWLQKYEVKKVEIELK